MNEEQLPQLKKQKRKRRGEASRVESLRDDLHQLRKELDREGQASTSQAYVRIACTMSLALDQGVDWIEGSIRNGMPKIECFGLAQRDWLALRSKIFSAMKSAGFALPRRRISLCFHRRVLGQPIDLAYLSLPLALVILKLTGQIELPQTILALGDLGLDGEVVCLNERLVTYLHYLNESALTQGLYGRGGQFLHLKQLKERDVSAYLIPLGRQDRQRNQPKPTDWVLSLYELAGQAQVKRAVLAAASGGHHLLICGSPGSGKSEWADLLVDLVPIEGEEQERTREILACLDERPVRRLHPPEKVESLIGKAKSRPYGAAALAHQGVLRLEELCQYTPAFLQALQTLLDEEEVTLNWDGHQLKLPAQFSLAATTNPCPCGHYLNPSSCCECAVGLRKRYWGKLTAAFLQRIDLQVYLTSAEPVTGLLEQAKPLNLMEMRQKIQEARWRQWHRYVRVGEVKLRRSESLNPGDLTLATLNARQALSRVPNSFGLSYSARDYLERFQQKKRLSLRQVKKLIGVARTLADLDGMEQIEFVAIAEAIQLYAGGMGR